MVLIRSVTVFLTTNYQCAPKNIVTNDVRQLYIKKYPIVSLALRLKAFKRKNQRLSAKSASDISVRLRVQNSWPKVEKGLIILSLIILSFMPH